MATLKAMFKLFDGYSSTINNISRKTNDATDKILKASGTTDVFNKKLEATGASASLASSGLGKLIGTLVSFAAVKKGMDITDTYVNTDARLGLINDGLQTQLELQDKIFAAADRSRGSYSEMADAVAKMGLLAGDAFGGNNQLIAFTELVQKSFKLGGADTSEQQGAMRQLSQAMASGRLQGDEFVSISENAPLILKAIEKYTGLSSGELKELSSDGAISANIIKNAMFMAGDDIEEKFKALPMTFGDIWEKISREALKAFRPVMESVNNLINTDGFQSIVNGVIIGINLIAKGTEWLFNTIAQHWNFIGPVLAAIGSVLLVNIVTGLWAMIAPLVLQGSLWAFMASPIFLVVLAIGIVITVLHDMGVTFEQVFGFIGGVVGIAVAGIWNLFLGLLEHIFAIINLLYNGWVDFTNLFGNMFENPISSIIYAFQNMGDAVLGIIGKIASAIDKVFGSNLADAVSGWRSGLKDMADVAVAKYAPNENYQEIMKKIDLSVGDIGWKRMDYSDSYTKGSDTGKGVYNNIADKISSLTDSLTGNNDMGLGDFGTPGSPLTVEGKGKKGAVKVDMSNEDLKYLRDVAERDYVAKIASNTLAPNIQVEFTGPISKEVDTDKLYKRIGKILSEQIATASEGDYA